MKSSKFALAVWVLIAFTAAIVGSQFGPGEWYRGLNKPTWNPPNWVFGPVWTLLYISMGTAAWGVWKERGFCAAHGIWLMQLAVNACWSWLFFGLKRPDWAFCDIVLLNVLITGTIGWFWRVKPWTGWILFPYQAWVLFASVLNYTLWQLNPSS